jgi:sulfide:quinone oxidoreductase
MVGGGVLGNVEQTKAKEGTYLKRSQTKLLKKGLNLKLEKVVKVNPESNNLETNQGNQITYEYLVICPGVRLRYDLISGA